MANSRTTRVQYHCSFCGKNQDQVKRLIAGPGAMTSIILLIGRAEGDIILQAIVIALMLFVLGLCLVAFLFAIPLMERLGVTGINVVGRVFGIVLAALAVQYIIDGMTDVLMRLPGRLQV